MTTDRQKVTHRGFTGHEDLDGLGLVHMNGRVYDPNLGRFLSVDPVFQFPTNTQSLNPYSYVLNNPLSMTDPSGYTVACAPGNYCLSTHEQANDGIQRHDPNTKIADLQTDEKVKVGDTTLMKLAGGGVAFTNGNGSILTQGLGEKLDQIATAADKGSVASRSNSIAANVDENGAISSVAVTARLQGQGSAPAPSSSKAPAVAAAGATAAAPAIPAGPSAEGLKDLMVFGAAVVKILGVTATALTLSGDTPHPTLNHYTTADGHAGIEEMRAIIPRNGEAFFTNSTFWSGIQAQKALQLSYIPVGFYKVPIENVVPVGVRRPVDGGSALEFIVNHPVSIEDAEWYEITP